MRGWVWISIAVSLTLFSSGCGSGSGGGSGTAQLRFVQAAPNAPLSNVVVDRTTQAFNVGYGNATAYFSVNSGSRHVQVVPVSGTAPIFSQTVSLADSSTTTLLMTSSGSSSQSLILTDGGTAPGVNQGEVRVVNVSANIGSPDVYIVIPGSSLGTPVTTSLAFGKDTGYQLVASGAYEVFMTQSGTASILLSTGPVNITSAQNQTVVVLDNPSGGSSFALLQDQ